ncbi:hypothetical protein [Halosimplex salinum]|uniref:hypothetical protein n=1 Tax=Halosimplex salinum TaxID=1710538 RepID=UPI000F497DE5|nr:hypothetical protein [Halosimplex salinum]
MPRGPTPDDGTDDAAIGATGTTRRSVLAAGAGVLGAGAVSAGALTRSSGVAAAQITEAAAIPTPERWSDANLAGFMIHVGGSIDSEQSQQAADCQVVGSDTWPPDEMLAFDAQLIDRKDDSTAEEETTLYIGASSDVEPGKLYIINRFNRCEDFVGVSLEQIGRADVNVEIDDRTTDTPADADQPDGATTESEDGGFGAVGPGFGPLAGLIGLLGGGALLARRGHSDSDPDSDSDSDSPGD